MKGRLITIEGGEGAGKTTSLNALTSALEQAGVTYDITREPGGTAYAEALRNLLLHGGYTVCPDAELLTVFAARAQHWHERILPALSAGRWVVSDRFVDATYAYQGGGRGIPAERIRALEQWLLGDFQPDRTVLLDVPVATGRARADARNAAEARPADHFESEQDAFFERVRSAYRERAASEPERFRIVDATQSAEAVARETVRVVEELLQFGWQDGEG